MVPCLTCMRHCTDAVLPHMRIQPVPYRNTDRESRTCVAQSTLRSYVHDSRLCVRSVARCSDLQLVIAASNY